MKGIPTIRLFTTVYFSFPLFSWRSGCDSERQRHTPTEPKPKPDVHVLLYECVFSVSCLEYPITSPTLRVSSSRVSIKIGQLCVHVCGRQNKKNSTQASDCVKDTERLGCRNREEVSPPVSASVWV